MTSTQNKSTATLIKQASVPVYGSLPQGLYKVVKLKAVSNKEESLHTGHVHQEKGGVFFQSWISRRDGYTSSNICYNHRSMRYEVYVYV